MGGLLEFAVNLLDDFLSVDSRAQQRLENRQKILGFGKRESTGRHEYLLYFNIHSPSPGENKDPRGGLTCTAATT